MADKYGSSPRVRGTVVALCFSGAQSRFIPACAGNGAWQPGLQHKQAVHPRVCGERVALRPVPSECFGSSPRVRGTVQPGQIVQVTRRFIPACAGNGGWPSVAATRRTVHPRVCGERGFGIIRGTRFIGSSPRVRGTAAFTAFAASRLRFIPACAGNGALRPVPRASVSVHPRVCGERASVFMMFFSLQRFIPACAGNGCAPARLLSARAVHPRVCGERASSSMPGAWPCGSSPRVRGTARCVRAPPLRGRFIPACAGNGVARGQDVFVLPVHPRVCGERLQELTNVLATVGSSPRVRGTEDGAVAVDGGWRFIPACAGNGSADRH